MKLLTKFNLALVVVFSLAMVPAGWVSHALLQRSARQQVIQNARIMMETAKAVRGYTISQVKPLLEDRLAETFLPQTVPAYSATEIFNALRTAYPEYEYKEATLNPSNPRDRTTDWEADVVNEFRRDPARAEFIGERDTPQGRSLFLSHPIKITDAKCLACHSTPEEAPASQVRQYGPSNGFGWKMGEIIGAQIVSVPMSVPVQLADRALWTLLAMLAGVFLLTLVVLNVLLRLAVTGPLTRLAAAADEASRGNLAVAEFEATGSDEVSVLAGSFNRMRISLQKAMAMLDDG